MASSPAPPDILPFDWRAAHSKLDDMFLQVSYLCDTLERAAPFPSIVERIRRDVTAGMERLLELFAGGEPSTVLQAVEEWTALPTLRGVVDAFPADMDLLLFVVRLVGLFAVTDELRLLVDNNGILDRFMVIVMQRKSLPLASAMLRTMERVKSVADAASARPMSQRQVNFALHVVNPDQPYSRDGDTCVFMMGTLFHLCEVEENLQKLVSLGIVDLGVAVAELQAAHPDAQGAALKFLSRLQVGHRDATPTLAAHPDILKLLLTALVDHPTHGTVQAYGGQVLSRMLDADKSGGAQKYVASHGALPHLMASIEAFTDDPEVLMSSMSIIRHLLADDHARYETANTGGAAVMLAIVDHHTDKPSVLAEAFHVMAVLAIPVGNWLLKNKVGAGSGHAIGLRAYERIMDALRSYAVEHKALAEGGVWCLAECATHFPRGREALYEGGIPAAVMDTMVAQPWSIPVQHHALRVLGALAEGSAERVEDMVRRRVPSAVIAGIKRHPQSPDVEVAGRQALWTMALLDDSGRTMKKYQLLVHRPPPVRITDPSEPGYVSPDSDFEDR